MTNGNDPINSVVQTQINSYGDERMECTDGGLTKREYFAAMAMQALITKSASSLYYKDSTIEAVQIADELIKALNK